MQQMGGGEYVHTVCPEWDLFACWTNLFAGLRDFVVERQSLLKFSPQFERQYNRLI